MSTCSYCKTIFDKDKHKKTKEHLFPKQIIGFFPEQYIAFSEKSPYIDKEGITIKDVCKECNNTLLGQLDSYGNDLIKTYFLEKYIGHNKQFDLKVEPDILKRWILKICFNYSRIKKDDELIFENAIKYILHGNKVVNFNFSLFMGLHVNTSPLPEEYYEYTPIQIYLNPSLNVHSYYFSTYMGWDLNSFRIELPYIKRSYSIRFGSAVFYLVVWNNDIEVDFEKIKHNIFRLEEQFQFAHISNKNIQIKRISTSSNSVIGYNHFVTKHGQMDEDVLLSQYAINGSIFNTQDELYNSKGEKGIEETRILVEKCMFPENDFIEKKYQKIFNK